MYNCSFIQCWAILIFFYSYFNNIWLEIYICQRFNISNVFTNNRQKVVLTIFMRQKCTPNFFAHSCTILSYFEPFWATRNLLFRKTHFAYLIFFGNQTHKVDQRWKRKLLWEYSNGIIWFWASSSKFEPNYWFRATKGVLF